jgi:hypothetical protein
MSRFLSRVVLPLAMVLLAALPPPAVSDPGLSAKDSEQVQQVIVAQIQALAEDDAERIFETTTPAVRAAIGSSGRFLAMMRGAYPMVYQPSSVTFHELEPGQDGAWQLVEITDREDQSWLALFALERQPDKTWRISGCLVAPNPWLTT